MTPRAPRIVALQSEEKRNLVRDVIDRMANEDTPNGMILVAQKIGGILHSFLYCF